MKNVADALIDSLDKREGVLRGDLAIAQNLNSQLIEQSAARLERIGELEAALRAQMAVNVMYMKRDGFSERDIADCTSQARTALGDA